MKFLVIRRDNIGDLVCTTPIFKAIKAKYPECKLDVLVNSYNELVLVDNPFVDDIFVYTKSKHRNKNQGFLSHCINQIKLYLKLRKNSYDYVILAGSDFHAHALNMAKWIKPKHIIGYINETEKKSAQIDLPAPKLEPRSFHEAEGVFNLLKTLDIDTKPGALEIYPVKAALKEAQNRIETQDFKANINVLGVHISVRRLSSRWSLEKFEDLINKVLDNHPEKKILLFWSPGSADNPMHPGDDEKAEQLLNKVNSPRVFGFETDGIPQLVAGLSLCNELICIDGGATHVGAALQIPMVCLFGGGDETRWYPWLVPNVLLQPPSKVAEDLSSDDVYNGYIELMEKIKRK